MRLVIDMQGAQTASRFRGIGRYTMSIVKAMVRQRGTHDVFLVLNGAYPDTIEPIRAAFDQMLPQDHIRVFEVAGPVGGHDAANEARRKAAELMREAFLASLNPDVVFISSLFEEFGGDAVTSIGVLDRSIPTAVVLYDLIPLIYSGVYLQNSAMQNWYYNKISHLRRADLLLSISESSGREAIENLNFPPSTTINISTSCDANFRRLTLSEIQKTKLRDAYGIDRPFIMYTGGNDHRKNIAGLFEAFADLPPSIRAGAQLVLVGRELTEDHGRSIALARQAGLQDQEVIFTGYVSDEDLVLLYNACTLFVFPSWHEGFGLPVLEAMACGRAVIAANASSLPEVVGREDALFAPQDNEGMAAKMAEVLSNARFRRTLERHGLEQAKKFSWEVTAHRAWNALLALHDARNRSAQGYGGVSRRRRLAFVSPLPPERTGIADYSAELLPELARYYDIDVVVAQSHVSDPWVVANAPIRDAAWFRDHAKHFDRVVYQIGNSPFHSHMFELQAEIPGVVVQHDFDLADVVKYMDLQSSERPHGWAHALLQCGGWAAVRERFTTEDLDSVKFSYPCNLEVLQLAQGVIVHSDHARELASKWYGDSACAGWIKIPLLRASGPQVNKAVAREKLNVPEDAFVLCSFGFLAPTKLNHRLLASWLASSLSQDARCYLVFVGENDGGDYGQSLLKTIAETGNGRIRITGYADAESYRTWLAASDAAVQLRNLSRGETSASVLDCMAYGLPTIVNAHGSMVGLPRDGVWMLADEFAEQELVDAITTLFQDTDRRQALGDAARQKILESHSPRVCAEQYRDAIEHFYAQAQKTLVGGLKAIARQSPALPPSEWRTLSSKMATNFAPSPRRKQLLLDISALVKTNLHSGIERVSRALLKEITLNPPEGWAVEPIYANTEEQGYRYARRFMCHFLSIPDDWVEDEVVDAWNGDVFLGLDLEQHVIISQQNLLQGWRQRGVTVQFVVFDLLPVTLPEVFPEGVAQVHRSWLKVISCFDGALCISRSVADRLYDWLQACGGTRERPYALRWFHLGADIVSSAPTSGLPQDADRVLDNLRARPSFLMVGTIEPRKGYLQTVAAFELLWARGIDVNLVIVGAEGWKPLPDALRRTIPQIAQKLRNHPERGRRLFWLEKISDEYLDKVQAVSSCLIAASADEGFGLPLIEAARHAVPLLVRDIPVFREVTAGHAYLFPDDLMPETISTAVEDWLNLYRLGRHSRGDAVPYQTWKDSARQVLDAVLGYAVPCRIWCSDGLRPYGEDDARIDVAVDKDRGRVGQTDPRVVEGELSSA